jgi:hypothetical protein
MPQGSLNTAQVGGFEPLHVNRLVTGLWTNTNPLRDAAQSSEMERYYGPRQDRLAGGKNTEISARLTLMRRPGLSVYNSNHIPPIKRFYSWNTFTLTTETIRVMADTNAAVYDVTGKTNTFTSIWQKSSGAVGLPTFFLGVGNVLYFTNGVDNKQLNNVSGKLSNWGIVAPTKAPTANQTVKPNPGYVGWSPSQVYSVQSGSDAAIVILDPSGTNLQMFVPQLGSTTYPDGHTGSGIPPVWNTGANATTTDGQVIWNWAGSSAWRASQLYGRLSFVAVTIGAQQYLFGAQGTNATSGANPPAWTSALGSFVYDGGVVWKNFGFLLTWPAIGPGRFLTHVAEIIDTNGYFQTCVQSGLTGTGTPTLPNFQTSTGDLSYDNNAIWMNSGSFNAAGTAPVQYGYAFGTADLANPPIDISEMSPASLPITAAQGNEITIQGVGSSDTQITTIYLYRTAQGGATFLLMDTIANPGAGTWTYNDNIPDSGLNTEIQAQVLGEGTPLPQGASCLEYHDSRIWAAVGNVLYGSSGPDAVISGSSGMAGFNTTFTLPSKITRLWANSLGMLIYTVRDLYMLAPDPNTGLQTVTRWIENMPLLSYDAWAVNLTIPFLLTGRRMVQQLNPAAGIIEASFPIADLIEGFNPASSYVTYHSENSGDTALYVSDGVSQWYRMAPNAAPDNGAPWSPVAEITGGMSAVQSVEVDTGQYKLLVGPPAAGGPILKRDTTTNEDNGTPFAADGEFGTLVLAQPSYLAALAWVTLEAKAVGTAPALSVLIGEITGTYENVPRTRQDPTNLPPSASLYSNRHSLLQSQQPVWCRHLRYTISWPPENFPNELLTSTIYGQMWQEQRSQ